MTLLDILSIFRHFIIQVGGTMKLAQNPAMATIFCFVLVSLRMYWSLYSGSFVPLGSLGNSFCFSGKKVCNWQASKIYSLISAVRIFYIIGSHVIGLQLLCMSPVFFVGGGLRFVFHFINSSMLASCKYLLSCMANLSSMNVNFLNQNPCIPSWPGIF